MKTIWEPSDIVCGRIVCKPLQKGERVFEPNGWTAKWTFKIGFVGGGGEDNYVMVCMCDGMVSRPRSKEQLAQEFNRDGLILMPHGWLIETMNFLRDSF